MFQLLLLLFDWRELRYRSAQFLDAFGELLDFLAQSRALGVGLLNLRHLNHEKGRVSLFATRCDACGHIPESLHVCAILVVGVREDIGALFLEPLQLTPPSLHLRNVRRCSATGASPTRSKLERSPLLGGRRRD